MTFEQAKERIDELQGQIEYHSRRYYDADAPEIEDDAFDALTQELRRLEEAYPELIRPDSYTQEGARRAVGTVYAGDARGAADQFAGRVFL